MTFTAEAWLWVVCHNMLIFHTIAHHCTHFTKEFERHRGMTGLFYYYYYFLLADAALS